MTCDIEGCDRPVLVASRGWCSRHYQRWQRHGDPEAGNRDCYQSPEESWAARTQKSGECIIWTGSADSNGYPRIYVGGEGVGAHRYAWEREHGSIPEGAEVDHICWEPMCVNIAHLRLATRPQNCSYLSGPNTRNTSGVRNVSPHYGGYSVRIKSRGTVYRFGTYPTLEQAAKVAARERARLFGEYAGRG